VEGVSFPLLYEGEGFSLRLHNAALLRYKMSSGGTSSRSTSRTGRTGKRPRTGPEEVGVQLLLEDPRAGVRPGGGGDPHRNVDRQTVTALRERLDSITGPTRTSSRGTDTPSPTAREGDRALVHGKPLVLVEGDDFAAAYFSIWLGKKPIDEDLKNELLRRG